MGHRGKYVCLIENSLTSSSHKQLLQQQNKTSDRPHGLRTWFMADWGRCGGGAARGAEPTTRLGDIEAHMRGGLLGWGWDGGGYEDLALSLSLSLAGLLLHLQLLSIFEINGDTVMRTSEESCIVAVGSFKWVCLSQDTGLCSEHLFLIFSVSWGSVAVTPWEGFV